MPWNTTPTASLQRGKPSPFVCFCVQKHINLHGLFNVTFILSEEQFWPHKKLVTVVECDPKVSFSIGIQEGISYHFLSLCYDSTWDWTTVSPAIGEHTIHSANRRSSCLPQGYSSESEFNIVITFPNHFQLHSPAR